MQNLHYKRILNNLEVLSVFVTGVLFLALEKTQKAYIYTYLIYVYMVKTLLGLFDTTSNGFNTDLLTVSGKSTPK